jgi:chemotaxis signal transduction protein
VENRRIVLAVDAVLGVRSIEADAFDELALLLDKARPEFLESVGILESRLLVVLRAARLLTEETWRALSSRGMAS